MGRAHRKNSAGASFTRTKILALPAKSANSDAVGRAHRKNSAGASCTSTKVLAVLVQKYLLYWYQSASTDAADAGIPQVGAHLRGVCH